MCGAASPRALSTLNRASLWSQRSEFVIFCPDRRLQKSRTPRIAGPDLGAVPERALASAPLSDLRQQGLALQPLTVESLQQLDLVPLVAARHQNQKLLGEKPRSRQFGLGEVRQERIHCCLPGGL